MSEPHPLLLHFQRGCMLAGAYNPAPMSGNSIDKRQTLDLLNDKVEKEYFDHRFPTEEVCNAFLLRFLYLFGFPTNLMDDILD